MFAISAGFKGILGVAICLEKEVDVGESWAISLERSEYRIVLSNFITYWTFG